MAIGFGLSFLVLFCSCFQSLLLQLFAVTPFSYCLHMAQAGSVSYTIEYSTATGIQSALGNK